MMDIVKHLQNIYIDHAKTMFEKYEKAGSKGNVSGHTPGTHAGGVFQNSKIALPTKAKDGKKIDYKEYEINYKIPRQMRDGERFVRGSDDSIYYTNDHYLTFIKIQ